jgi:uncharacterized protein (TIGR03435 family)
MRHVVYRCIVAAACFLSVIQAQTPAPAFEAASIRAGDPRIGGEPNVQVTPGALTIRNQPFFLLVQWAYDVPPAQIDGPAWFRDTPFDVVAKAAGPADETQLRLMLQTLLAQRFGLKLHKEARVMQVYAMTLAKGGPKFQESPTEGTFELERTNRAVLNAHHARMSDLAQGISGEIGRPVVDETGLKGRYEIHMDISPYLTQPSAGNNGVQVDMLGILFTGLQDILGLKLESRKESVDMLVIDHAEKSPTEN